MQIIVNGVTYSDDSDPVTGMGNGGSRKRFLPMVSNALIEIGAKAAIAFTAVANAAIATAAANTATNAAATAVARATEAAVYAAQAQATNPDSPIRINPRKITADFTVGSGYNAQSTGPITVADGVTVTVQDNATYAIQ